MSDIGCTLFTSIQPTTTTTTKKIAFEIEFIWESPTIQFTLIENLLNRKWSSCNVHPCDLSELIWPNLNGLISYGGWFSSFSEFFSSLSLEMPKNLVPELKHRFSARVSHSNKWKIIQNYEWAKWNVEVKFPYLNIKRWMSAWNGYASRWSFGIFGLKL